MSDVSTAEAIDPKSTATYRSLKAVVIILGVLLLLAFVLVVVGIGMAWGTDAGYAINPARDFGPRLASYVTGYHGAFRDQHGDLYFWVPIIGPLVGGVIGAGLYKALIGRFLPAIAATTTAASASTEPASEESISAVTAAAAPVPNPRVLESPTRS